jgi:16S rRNA (cytosine1402-N4)-methyltransferase
VVNTASKTRPAHRPVLFDESLDGLAIATSGTYLDGTFGRGGHSQGILQRLGADGRLIALDRDPDAIAAGQQIGDPRLTLVHTPFSALEQVSLQCAPRGLDGVFLDLGVSSPQLDEAQRGFSFKNDGPLDMRMDTTRGMSALQWLEIASEQEIAQVLKDYGQERAAIQIAKTIVTRRRDSGSATFQTTRGLASLVAGVLGHRQGSKGGRAALGKDPATRSFQAIRIFVNQELEELAVGLEAALNTVRVGGRIAVISFHSLEDRIVKQFFSQHAGKFQAPELKGSPERSGLSTVLAKPRVHSTFAAGQRPEQVACEPKLKLFKKVLPSDQEQSINPRSRSAVLRVAEKLA